MCICRICIYTYLQVLPQTRARARAQIHMRTHDFPSMNQNNSIFRKDKLVKDKLKRKFNDLECLILNN